MLALALYGLARTELSTTQQPAVSGQPDVTEATSLRIKQAFDNKRSDIQVTGQGEVTRLLPDDNEGSRHQRFIVELSSGHTLLVSHNIDLAPRIESLKKGDIVSFHGEYEWNPQGGVIHWTHHDPAGRHAGGWIELNGRRYE